MHVNAYDVRVCERVCTRSGRKARGVKLGVHVLPLSYRVLCTGTHDAPTGWSGLGGDGCSGGTWILMLEARCLTSRAGSLAAAL